MAKLDRGTALATGEPGKESWWDATAKATAELRSQMLASVDTVADDPQVAGPDLEPQPVPDDPQPAQAVADDDDDEEARVAREVADEVREMTGDDEGFDFYPKDETGQSARYEDATAEHRPAGPGEQYSWEDPKPAPRDRRAALADFARTLDQLMQRPDLRDPADPTGCTVIVTAGMIADEYGYRSRPFFSEVLNGMAAGRIGRAECPTDVIVTAAPDLGPTAGKYRLQRPRAGNAQ